MPSPSPSPDDDLEELPGFQSLPEEETPTPEPGEEPSPTASPSSPAGATTRPTTTPLGGAAGAGGDPRHPKTRSASSLASISEDLEGELANLGGGFFELIGALINKVVRMRNHTQTRLWLVSEPEAEDFGRAASRIAIRHIPDELLDGDGADLVIMGSVALGYATHSLAGVDDLGNIGSTPQARTLPGPDQQQQGPPAPVQAAAARVGRVDTEEPTPAPPSVISPGM